ncbi:LPS export ABC transporter permease LptF [Orrella sp. NBD-18]|uniref:Lipopolysaccharide export system permease protein LptF n=1 Tax=Sheuella amnicola TaxID=2707330 RepID=A0A6B2QZH9_9BURK|nr:LPS export ABC transporter permease LptF [Sheuella amnicola]NDY82167.1 LPS export ABC transporter permease LptF [Sheuella amnicola]HBI83546.1 LPS export ABC transporter permease LptF [Alcaligenaceae bacterium]
MNLFKKSVISETLSHFSVVVSTLIVIWLSVILVRLIGEAAAGRIGVDIVVGLAIFTTLAALPTILTVSLFIGVLTTISRNYRESEMVVWFASGMSLLNLINPVLRVAVPIMIAIAGLTLYVTPWANRQIEDYRARFEMRSDVSKITPGQFFETEGGKRVVFTESSETDDTSLGQVFMRILDQQWLIVVTATSAHTEIMPNGDRFLVLEKGYRYDLKPGTAEMKLAEFDAFGVRIERKDGEESMNQARNKALANRRARPTMLLIGDSENGSWGQIMWRIAIPLAALNLALLAIPIGAVNPRMGRSGNLLIAGLVAMLYLNLINISQGWIIHGKLPFSIGVWLVHILFAIVTAILLWWRMRVKKPKPPVVDNLNLV